MRASLVILLFLSAMAGYCQSKLTKARVQMVYSTPDEQFQVTERLHFDTLKAGQTVVLKSLSLTEAFDEESELEVDHSGSAEVGSVAKSDAFQSFQLKIEQAQKNGWIEVSYLISKGDPVTEIPLYFTEFSAASSAEDFFALNLELPASQQAHFHFPTVSLEEAVIDQGRKSFSFAMPALPSMIRLELPEEESKASLYISLIDMGVAVVFLIIGVLIFRYRNLLMYG